MIRHYFKIAFRNLLKYKTQSIISIIGLAVGITCFALATLWIRYEMTYDTFHRRADDIYLSKSTTHNHRRHAQQLNALSGYRVSTEEHI